MKKKWKWIIAVIVVLLCFQACGSKPKKNTKPTATLPTVSQTVSTVPAATAPMAEAPTEPETEATTEPETVPETEAPTQPETTVPATEADQQPTGIRPEFKEAMDAYEAFYDEYCTFMEDYMKNPTDLSLLGKYAGMLAKVEEMDKKFDAWDESEMSNEELKYYLEVNTRVQKRIIDLI